jgi:hypothetical protein
MKTLARIETACDTAAVIESADGTGNVLGGRV